MKNRKRFGFTVIELVVVIVVISLLVTITGVAYRNTQSDARNKKRLADALILKSAVDEYFADTGSYPDPGPYTCNVAPGYTNECWRNEMWTMLKDAGYLTKIPTPDGKAHNSSYNVGADSYSNYGYVYNTTGYGIYIPQEPIASACKVGVNVVASWWGSRELCNI